MKVTSKEETAYAGGSRLTAGQITATALLLPRMLLRKYRTLARKNGELRSAWKLMPEPLIEKCTEGALLGCGNPLLDIQARVHKHFLTKWKLQENNAILADDSHVPMFEELVSDFEVEYIPGGATQNALRVCQWILKVPNRVTFLGAIGSDSYGSILKRKATEAGVNVQYQINENVKTGTCAALIYQSNRSLCAHLAAANTFTVDHLEKPENEALIGKAKFYYISGFFLTVCPPAVQKIAKHACDFNKVFTMNLAAPFISTIFKEVLLDALPYMDIVFGNESEAQTFAQANNFTATDVKEIAKEICALPKENQKRKRIVIITQGSDPTIVAQGNTVREFPVARLKQELIVDTNAAGDAFCGGFLSQYIQGKSLEESIECGHYAAATIIQQNGCTFPATCAYH